MAMIEAESVFDPKPTSSVHRSTSESAVPEGTTLEASGKSICPDLLLDDLVGAQQNRLRHREAESLGGLEVDDHVELGR